LAVSHFQKPISQKMNKTCLIIFQSSQLMGIQYR